MAKIEKVGTDKNKDKAYNDALLKIVKTIEKAQVKTMMAANTQLLWAYWNIGNELSRRTTSLSWGTKVIDTLSQDIRKRFPALKGFSSRNLLYMRQFAEEYPPHIIEKLNQLWLQVNSDKKQLVTLIKSTEIFKNEIT